MKKLIDNYKIESAILTYGFLWVIILIMLMILKPTLFVEKNFLNWDAEHYHWIAFKGYLDFRVAFFPLFPLLWKYSQLGIYGISIANFIIFIASFYVLMKALKISSFIQILGFLTIPSFVFFMVPYTESIFFLSSIVIIIGLKRNDFLVLCIGLFLSTLARPAFTVFFPALILIDLISKDKEWSKLIINWIIYALVFLVGILLVNYIQWLDTGEWFKTFSVQKKWGNELQIPKFPLSSWGGGMITRLDAYAMIIGLISGIVLLITLVKKNMNIPKEVLFSLAYCAGITLMVIFFRGGLLFSLNRFVFATPFVIVIFNYWFSLKNIQLNNKTLLYFFVGSLLFWLAFFKAHVHIQTFLKYAFLSGYIFLPILIVKEGWQNKIIWGILLILNISFQILLFVKFLSNEWVA